MGTLSILSRCAACRVELRPRAALAGAAAWAAADCGGRVLRAGASPAAPTALAAFAAPTKLPSAALARASRLRIYGATSSALLGPTPRRCRVGCRRATRRFPGLASLAATGHSGWGRRLFPSSLRGSRGAGLGRRVARRRRGGRRGVLDEGRATKTRIGSAAAAARAAPKAALETRICARSALHFTSHRCARFAEGTDNPRCSKDGVAPGPAPAPSGEVLLPRR